MRVVDTTRAKQCKWLRLTGSAWLSVSLFAGACGDAAPRHVQRTYVRVNERDMQLDLYLPRGGDRPVPVILMFHGGGWIQGTPRQAREDLEPFLAAGWAGVTPAYRLAPADHAPAALEDAECALRWVGEHAGEFGLDRDRIVVAGYSAGGYLALMLGILPESTTLARHCSRSSRPRPALVVNLAGITDLAELLGDSTRRDWAVEWVGPGLGPESLPSAWSPLRNLHAGVVPVLTLQGDHDEVVPYSQSVRLHRALDRLGVTNRLVTLRGARHRLPVTASRLALRQAGEMLRDQPAAPTPAGGRPPSR